MRIWPLAALNIYRAFSERGVFVYGLYNNYSPCPCVCFAYYAGVEWASTAPGRGSSPGGSRVRDFCSSRCHTPPLRWPARPIIVRVGIFAGLSMCASTAWAVPARSRLLVARLSGAEIAAIEGQLKGYFCPGSNSTAQQICCARGGSCIGSRLWPERVAALLARTVYGTASLQ